MTSPQIKFNENTFRQQLGVMLTLQASMNAVVFPDWASRGLAWHRAIYVEAGEYLEHMATWKWWKKGTPDYPQANMELVDIWHFGLSWYIERFGQPVGSEALSTAVIRRIKLAVNELENFGDVVTDEMRHEQVDALVASAGQRLFNTDAFVKLMIYSGMDFEQLFQRYIGKNVLNQFRQANGYKTGTYSKVWAGQEDNVHLDEILLEVEEAQAGVADEAAAAAQFPRLLKDSLTARYQNLVLSGRPSVALTA